MAEHAIEVSAVSKEFVKHGRRVEALQAIDVVVARNEFAAIVGPSGCGKSTLLNMVAGFDRPSRGQVLVHGEPVAGPDPSRGVVFQEPALFPWLRVDGNVGFPLRVRGLEAAEIRRRVDAIVERVGLAAFGRSYPAELSGGMRQRVAIARVLAMDPPVLLMDEPFGALDAQTRLLMQEFLLQVLVDRAATVLFVTHDLEEAIFLADRVFILSARPGRVKARLDVPLPRPRPPECRTLPAFHEAVDRTFGLVREEALRALQLAGRAAGG
jgi:ABC-type nitrate/sulfonate/bicarbonate transport system ATPase subunit